MSLDQIFSRLSNLNCNGSEQQHHVLKLEFPIGSLLPDGSHLYLEPPKDVTHRCEPPEDRRVSGILDLDFPVVLTPHTIAPTAGTAPHQVLLDAVVDLPRLGGLSVLSVASYFDEATSEVVYLYRLTTTTVSGFSSSRYFKLDSNESCMLFGLAPMHDWVSLLQHLVSRSSELAYYHVRKQLTDQYGIASAFEEERRWETVWSESQRFNLRDAFHSRVKSVFPDSATGERNALRLQLPCGHVMHTSTSILGQMYYEEYSTIACPHCEAPVLQYRVLYEVEVAVESLERHKRQRKNAHWISLDHVPSVHTRNFEGKSLATAIRAALGSFMVSDLVAPPSLCFAATAYTQSIMQHFESFLSDESVWMNQRSEILVDYLIQDALETVSDANGRPLSITFVSPAFVKFLYAWLCRAVNFLCDRECNEMKASHLGVHRHGGKLMYNPALWQAGGEGEQPLAEHSDEQQHVDVDMDALNADMEEMDLEGTSALHALLDSMDIEKEQDDEELDEEL
ncbi:hypothetical protein CLAFUW4_11511 [Fulvia fulva]|uniref:Uncharacterized protein n=1 Tax=Passalora fulva TaxID=5499 RepID=A0A9Q8URZ3_PASFU|nr:uncharacterized protein CLAFUR5_10554 [Fulvia fulva]KAK4620061.1 hypothetical protein CLAFUR4_11517 [Fulvia fulva]KAK4620943.1 hypothetical protein CLAFUR0_11525 [Fulvia fulva]UJO20232.1 hypothetical protein CLAFUR5_10554 [Fulvia fulva]WPV17549.1 hypothetical protein CLAFUW4_11511 [Fulvia fulva]WPV32167.1 hypothetical protein CLAFUW7_11516 [Fulvia fulva]